jgi:hypothetical protein
VKALVVLFGIVAACSLDYSKLRGNPDGAEGNSTPGLGGGGESGSAGNGNTGLSGMRGTAGDGLAGAGGATGHAGTGSAGATAGSGGTGVAGNGDAGMSGIAGLAGGAGGQGGAAGASGVAGTAGSAGAAGTGAINYCDRSHWTATASTGAANGGGGPPSNAIDGDLMTRWATNRGQLNTDYYAVNFGGTVKLTKITLNNEIYPTDYPGTYAVYASTDGTTFGTTAIATGSGTSGTTVISFSQQSVRAVRVNQTATNRGTYWWELAEFQVDCTL